MTALSMYIRTLRGRHDLTQPEVADRVGVDKATVWRWENEGRRPDGPTMGLLLDALHGHTDDIREIDAEPSNAMKGEQLAKERYIKYKDRIEEIISETPPEELDAILEGIRAEARRNPSVLDTLRSLLDALRARDGHQSH